MRTKRENTYGMPARILANADRGRIVQDANDCNDFQTAVVAADPRPNGPNRLPNALCACVRRGSLMPGGDASRLTSSHAVLDRTLRPILPGLRATRVQGASSKDLAEDVARLRSAAEQTLAILP